MFGSWSVILNILLLAGVMVAIFRMLRAKRDDSRAPYQPLSSPKVDNHLGDDIIAVRKVTRELAMEAPTISAAPPTISVAREESRLPKHAKRFEKREEKKEELNPTSVMMFLLAKEERLLAGYELLQTLLAAGLRFGEGNLFHRHQFSNGQGPVLCSVAAATSTGMFDLHNIGSFTVRGLCIFMEASGNAVIDEERFVILLDTAKQLSEDLDTYLLDEKRQPLTETSIARYHRILSLTSKNHEEKV